VTRRWFADIEMRLNIDKFATSKRFKKFKLSTELVSDTWSKIIAIKSNDPLPAPEFSKPIVSEPFKLA
jgi:hypothetical protein